MLCAGEAGISESDKRVFVDEGALSSRTGEQVQ